MADQILFPIWRATDNVEFNNLVAKRLAAVVPGETPRERQLINEWTSRMRAETESLFEYRIFAMYQEDGKLKLDRQKQSMDTGKPYADCPAPEGAYPIRFVPSRYQAIPPRLMEEAEIVHDEHVRCARQPKRPKPKVIRDDRYLYDVLCHPETNVKHLNVKRPRCVVCGMQAKKYCCRCEGTPALCPGFCFVYYHHPNYPRPHDFEQWNDKNRDIDALVAKHTKSSPRNEDKKSVAKLSVSVGVNNTNCEPKK